MDLSFSMSAEDLTGIEIGHISVDNLPLNPDGTVASTLPHGAPIPSDFVRVDDLGSSGSKKRSAPGGPSNKGKKKKTVQESLPFTGPDVTGPEPVRSVYALRDEPDDDEEGATDSLRQRTRVSLPVGGVQQEGTAERGSAGGVSERDTAGGSGNEVVQEEDGSRRLLLDASSSLSLPDMDEDDDATDFLGGARGYIPPGPDGDLGSSPVFVPSWGFEVGNPGRDLRSCKDYVLHAMPPAIEEKMGTLSARQSYNRGVKAHFDSIMWGINTLKTTDKLEKLSRKLRLDLKEEKAKAAQDREAFDKFKAEHAADISRVDVMALELASLKARLAEQEAKAAEMESALQQSGLDLNTCRAERDEAVALKNHAITDRDYALVCRDDAVAERDAAIAERNAAVFEKEAAYEEKRKLHLGLPDLIITAMGCKGIVTPFGELVKCARVQGQHEVASLAARLVDPLPEAIAAKIDPEAMNRWKAAAETLKNLSTSPFLEKLVEDPTMPVDALLAMKPE